jgi:hypothetical protein
MDQHLRSLGHGTASDRLADAGGTAGNENGFVFESH